MEIADFLVAVLSTCVTILLASNIFERKALKKEMQALVDKRTTEALLLVAEHKEKLGLQIELKIQKSENRALFFHALTNKWYVPTALARYIPDDDSVHLSVYAALDTLFLLQRLREEDCDKTYSSVKEEARELLHRYAKEERYPTYPRSVVREWMQVSLSCDVEIQKYIDILFAISTEG